MCFLFFFFFFQAEDGIRDLTVTGVQTCALPIIESTMILSEAEVLTVANLPRGFVGESVPAEESLRELNRRSEYQQIMAVLARTRFDKRKAARILGISLASLYRKLGERGISNSSLQD